MSDEEEEYDDEYDDEYEESEFEEFDDENEITYRSKWMCEGCRSIDAMIRTYEREIKYLRRLKEEGWVLDGGMGTCESRRREKERRGRETRSKGFVFRFSALRALFSIKKKGGGDDDGRLINLKAKEKERARKQEKKKARMKERRKREREEEKKGAKKKKKVVVGPAAPTGFIFGKPAATGFAFRK